MPRAGLIRCALVVAGAEGAPGAGEDDHADGAVGIGPVEDPMQLGFELVRECVHALGPIERDGRDAFLDAVKDLLAHPSSSRCCGRPWGGARPHNTLVRSKVKVIYVDTTIAARHAATTCSFRSARMGAACRIHTVTPAGILPNGLSRFLQRDLSVPRGTVRLTP